ncbi:hypothetical protein Dsin_018196 [Dipteronia sinensis]|uniref:ATPase AAA-type core domain-containing protein n=1 Tax=Dipteronia sinensis TaxID=43782 RepID=A0AAE0A4V5_9ROSI|nr:hypothetical protein Dsin_018196 [Dipteronia sinensis]
MNLWHFPFHPPKEKDFLTFEHASSDGLNTYEKQRKVVTVRELRYYCMSSYLKASVFDSSSPAKRRHPSNHMVGFDDVEGVDAAKVELMEIKDPLQSIVNEFVELFVGRVAARVRDLFNAARTSAPAIIFINELDVVGGKRGRSFNDERDQTLNQLLKEMDGFESEMKVVVITATNRPEALDPALCRPGRFSRKVFVGEPDREGRRKILAVHLRGVPLEEDTHLICDLVTSLTPGFVGADLANIVNEAALLTARRGGIEVYCMFM